MYGDRMADIYDDLPVHPSDADAAATCLAELAGAGPALELAIGTGRVALPLAGLGVAVSGIDASEAMVAKLRAKPGGDGIPVTIGDFADVDVDDGRFALIFVVYNTFFVLLDQARQRRCFEQVAERLVPGGRFVIEAFVPDPSRFERGQHIEVRHVATDSALLSVSRHDAATQRVDSLHVRLGDDAFARGPCTSGTPTPPSWTSWPNGPGCGSSSAGAVGIASRSPATASSMCPCTPPRRRAPNRPPSGP